MLPLFHVSSLAGPLRNEPIQVFNVRNFMGMEPHFLKREEPTTCCVRLPYAVSIGAWKCFNHELLIALIGLNNCNKRWRMVEGCVSSSNTGHLFKYRAGYWCDVCCVPVRACVRWVCVSYSKFGLSLVACVLLNPILSFRSLSDLVYLKRHYIHPHAPEQSTGIAQLAAALFTFYTPLTASTSFSI